MQGRGIRRPAGRSRRQDAFRCTGRGDFGGRRAGPGRLQRRRTGGGRPLALGDGGAAQCALTPEQAEAFAQIIEEAAGESQSLYGKPELKQYALCQVALFDAGNGIPALLVAEGYYYDYGIREITRQDYQFYKGEVYYWDGSQAVALLDSQPQYLVLTDRGLEVSYAYSDYTETYPLSDGRISAEPAERYISFRLVGDTQPTEADLQTEIAAYENLDMSFDFTTLTGDKWSQETVWDKYDQENVTYWRIAASDGAFIRYSDDTRPAHRLSPDNWLVGVGLDIFRRALRLLPLGGQAGATAHRPPRCSGRGPRPPGRSASRSPSRPRAPGRPPAQVPVPRIQRIDWDQPINNMEVYFEMPVFDNASGGYQVINQFFQQKQEAFFSPDNPSLARAQEWDSPENHIPPNEIYTYCYTVQIKDCTDQLFSATLSSSWYMGGQYGAGRTPTPSGWIRGSCWGWMICWRGARPRSRRWSRRPRYRNMGSAPRRWRRSAAIPWISSSSMSQRDTFLSALTSTSCLKWGRRSWMWS